MITYDGMLGNDKLIRLQLEGDRTILSDTDNDNLLHLCKDTVQNIRDIYERFNDRANPFPLLNISIIPLEPIPEIDYVRFNNRDYSVMDYEAIRVKRVEYWRKRREAGQLVSQLRAKEKLKIEG